jgi:DNA-binding response OmpR family regulator
MKDSGLSVPTIIITGFPEREKIISAAQMGIQDVLVKPVRHQELMQMIRAKLGVGDEAEPRQAS